MAPTIGVLFLAGALAAVHLGAGKLQFLRAVPRSRWLSLCGGISVAYVFVHLLPEITEHQSRVVETTEPTNVVLEATHERSLFIAALVGFAFFYGLEQAARRSSRGVARRATAGVATRPDASVFWLHIGSFAAYNALIGYFLLHREETGLANLVLYGTAMGLHFVVNDYGLRDHHRDVYDRLGRWILAGAILAGTVLGFLVGLPELVLSLLLAFLSGGVILNVIKEELPEDRESRFWAFGAGLAGYTAVLLVI
ncbi:hypothetical protein SAMN04487967_3291 [Natronorubrum sediminis]|uniref:ZIP Zinc transporter n=1 Tax=Natronorubrum sediminis TaxID=640943 RepID=A0A1H6G3E9_9EURY|nr:hypothetical protein [Natronorubrum sediminis]SEH17616.1 hypothetical protein SAMN04487967_3291 [Natronorubrum sediminis]